MAIENIPTPQTGWFGMQHSDDCPNRYDSTVHACTVRCGMQILLWVTAYAIYQNYGGPEEGGWWYDSGEALASIPCRTDAEVNEAIERLASLYKEQYEAEHNRTDSRGDGADLCICVEAAQGKHWPDVRPHYE